MEMYADEGDLQRTLQTAIRVAAYQHKCVVLLLVLLTSLTNLYKLCSEYAELSVCHPFSFQNELH